MTGDSAESGAQNERECKICGDTVDAGIIGMSNHIELDHTQQEIVEEVSDSV